MSRHYTIQSLFLLVCLSTVYAAPVEVSSIAELTGDRHARVVWSEGLGSSLDIYAIESKDGVDGSIRDVGVNGDMVFLSPDGDRILYRSSNNLCMIDWDGTNQKTLKTGASIVHVWQDESNDKQWAYFTAQAGDNQKPLKRLNIDNPTEEVTVLTNVGIGWGYFGSSWDEKWAFAATPTWGTTKLVNMQSEATTTYGVGCETTMMGPLDNDKYYLLETGQFTHQSLIIYELGNTNGTELISPTIGKGDHHFGFSTWAWTKTDNRYIVGRSPDNFNKTAANHLLFVRLNSTYDAIDAWLQVSPDNDAPFASHAWIAEGATRIEQSRKSVMNHNNFVKLVQIRNNSLGVNVGPNKTHSVTIYTVDGRTITVHRGVGPTMHEINIGSHPFEILILNVASERKKYSQKILLGN